MQRFSLVIGVIVLWTGQAWAAATLENPVPGALKSGVGVISGWVCDAEELEISFDGGPRLFVPYGSERTDTAGVCDDTDNGFGLLWNYNELGNGPHTVTLYIDGVLTTQVGFNVRTLGTKFLQGVTGSGTIALSDGKQVNVQWEETTQGFTITGYTTDTEEEQEEETQKPEEEGEEEEEEQEEETTNVEDPRAALRSAIAQPDAAQLQTLLDAGVDPNLVIGHDGRTALHVVAGYPDREVIAYRVQYFEDRLAEIEAAENLTPAYKADLVEEIQEELTEAQGWLDGTAKMRALVQTGADVTIRDDLGATPLYHLFQTITGEIHLRHWYPDVMTEGWDEYVERLTLLLEAGADIDTARSYDGKAGLHMAAEGHHLPLLQFLLAQGANPNIREHEFAWESEGFKRNQEAFTPLHYAVQNVHYDSAFLSGIQALLEAGADPNITTHLNGRTVLFFIESRAEEYEEIERLLIAYGADPTIPEADGDRYRCRTVECRQAGGE